MYRPYISIGLGDECRPTLSRVAFNSLLHRGFFYSFLSFGVYAQLGAEISSIRGLAFQDQRVSNDWVRNIIDH